MPKKNDTWMQSYWNEPDDRPLVEIIASGEGGHLRCVDTYYGKRLYVISDWVFLVGGKKEKDRSEAWRKLKASLEAKHALEGKVYIQSEPIQTNGGVQTMDVCDQEGLYYITQHMKSSPTTNKIRRFLAAAGVLTDTIRLEPETALDVAREAYRAQGKSEKWIDARLKGKINRKSFVEALQEACKYMDDFMYGLNTNQIYFGLWQRTVDMLADEMQLKNTRKFRDKQPMLALLYQSIAEEVCAQKLANEPEKIHPVVAADIIFNVALMIGADAHKVSKFLGRDIATDTPLSVSETKPRLDGPQKAFLKQLQEGKRQDSH